MSNHPNESFILGGDMNCNPHQLISSSSHLRDFMFTHDFCFTDHNLDTINATTYQHTTMNSKSYIDFIFIQTNLLNSSEKCKIIDFDLNFVRSSSSTAGTFI